MQNSWYDLAKWRGTRDVKPRLTVIISWKTFAMRKSVAHVYGKMEIEITYIMAIPKKENKA